MTSSFDFQSSELKLTNHNMKYLKVSLFTQSTLTSQGMMFQVEPFPTVLHPKALTHKHHDARISWDQELFPHYLVHGLHIFAYQQLRLVGKKYIKSKNTAQYYYFFSWHDIVWVSGLCEQNKCLRCKRCRILSILVTYVLSSRKALLFRICLQTTYKGISESIEPGISRLWLYLLVTLLLSRVIFHNWRASVK